MRRTGYFANVTRVRAAPFYRDALARAETCPELIAELGQPLEADLPNGGTNSLSGTPVKRAIAQMHLEALACGQQPGADLRRASLEDFGPAGETPTMSYVPKWWSTGPPSTCIRSL